MKRYAFYLVVFAALLSGTGGLFVKFMEIPPSSMAWLRMTTPTILVGLYLLYKGKGLLRPGYKMMIAASAINAARMLFFFMAYMYTSIANAVIVLYTWPIFAVILSSIFLKEHISKKQIGLLMLSFTGIIVVYAGHELSLNNEDFKGLSAGVLCAFLYSCTVVIFKSESTSFNPSETIFFQNFLGAFIFLPFFITNDPGPRILDWVLGSGQGVIIGIIMFGAFFYGLKYIKASKASMIAYIEVISAMILGYLVFGETLTVNMMIGASLIVCSTLLLQLNKK